MDRILFGAFDPIYPNGLFSCANDDNIFGLRIVTRDDATGELSEGRSLDMTSLKIGPIDADRYFTVAWKHAGKQARLTWGRLDEKNVYGRVEMEDGLSVLIELYIPREYRLKYRWANFTRQADRVLTGEMIAPFGQPACSAMRLLLERAPECELGYNDRGLQMESFSQTGELINLTNGTIWQDMGLSWLRGAKYSRPVSFVYTVDDPEAFLELPGDVEIDRLLKEGRNQLEKHLEDHLSTRLTGLGALEGVPEAVISPIWFNTMYREDKGHRFVMVDRPWARNDDGWGIAFNWDTFLSSLSACWIDDELAKENILGGLDVQLPDGRIPLYTHQALTHRAEAPITAGRGQHIVQGYTVWQTYLRTRDKDWLARCYDKVKRAHAWWLSDRGDGQAYRDGLGKGMIGFGYDPEYEMGVLGARVQPYVAKAQYAYFEIYDDSPQWTDGVFFKTVMGMNNITENDVTDVARYLDKTHTANLYLLERCCLYAVQAECLAKMATELDKPDEAEKYAADYERMKNLVNANMWDEEDGCYYNLHFDGKLRKVKSPDCFMPMMAGIASPERIERMMKHMLSENTFWNEYKMPSVSRDDPAYADQKYWRGQIWPPMIVWTHAGLRRAGKLEEAWALAETSSKMLRREWQERNYYPENYNGNTGRCSGSPHYNWGTLMGTVALNEMIELTPDAVTFGRTCAPDGTGLKGIRLDGHIYDVLKKDGRIIVSRDGELIAEEAGGVTLKR